MVFMAGGNFLFFNSICGAAPHWDARGTDVHRSLLRKHAHLKRFIGAMCNSGNIGTLADPHPLVIRHSRQSFNLLRRVARKLKLVPEPLRRLGFACDPAKEKSFAGRTCCAIRAPGSPIPIAVGSGRNHN
jgi:hypothetical protein